MSALTAVKVTSQLTDSEFDQLFRDHYQLVYRTAFSVTRCAEDAEDVLQSVFLKLIRRQFPPDLKKNPKAYLYRAAFNGALDIVRARPRDLFPTDCERLANAVSTDWSFAEEAERRLYDAIATLPLAGADPHASLCPQPQCCGNREPARDHARYGSCQPVPLTRAFAQADSRSGRDVMKRSEENTTLMLGRFLDRHFSPSNEQVEAAGDRVLQRLHADDTGTAECPAIEPDLVRPQRIGRRRAVALTAITVVLVILSAVPWRTSSVDVVATSVEGRAFAAGQPLRSNDGKGTVVTLADGSRVEIRAGSEATVERAADGLRVRLNAGSIIVNAAQQAAGKHLYVSTRDTLVSVVGTVFLVKADKQGSHVAVIQGEVHVKQGGVEKNLRPGEQTSSMPKAEELALQVEIGWSREAAAYLAMLHEEMAQSLAARQPAAPAAVVPAQIPKTPRFEAASVRPCPKDFQAPEGMRGGGSNSMRLSPGRLDALCMTVATLIRTAYRQLKNNDVFPGVRSLR